MKQEDSENLGTDPEVNTETDNRAQLARQNKGTTEMKTVIKQL